MYKWFEHIDISSSSRDTLKHYGTPQLYPGSPTGSGRYRKGTGDDPYQHNNDAFRARVKEFRAQGYSDTEIAHLMDMSTDQFRRRITVSKAQEAEIERQKIQTLVEAGMSNVAIAKELGSNEGHIRDVRKRIEEDKMRKFENVANTLKTELESGKPYLDVGKYVDKEMGVSDNTLKTSLLMLQDEGYIVDVVKIPQATMPGQFTEVKFLAPPNDEMTRSEIRKDIYNNPDKVKPVQSYFEDDGKTSRGIYPPESISSSRIKIVYGDEGGKDKDGVIEIRPGVDDISLGNSNYAQVRVAVDGTHYLKGMAMYNNNLPDGIDIVFNTNKPSGTPKEKVFKELKNDDPSNPFGSYIKPGAGVINDGYLTAGGQAFYKDQNGKYVKDGDKFVIDISKEKSGERYNLSVINKVNEEGDWGEWSKTLSSQFLSKQPRELIKKQLDLSYSEKLEEYEEIMNLTNPVLKQKLLISFADDCDSSSVHLKAAGLPNQAARVILPITSLKDNEIYDPDLNDGDRVVLIRHPHAGPFEIPELIVNNRNSDGKSLLGNAADAVGINSKVAERLSGADFDGDTVLVIPVNNKVRIKSYNSLSEEAKAVYKRELEGFDPKEQYRGYEGMEVISPDRKQTEMGKVSNLITDMTLQGAPPEHISRAVRHSMVIIDAEKHKLDWRRSEQENNIQELKELYQKKDNGKAGGASTLISKAKSQERINERKEASYKDPITGKTTWGINPNTGEKYYEDTGREKFVYKKDKQKYLKDDNGIDILDSNGNKVKNPNYNKYLKDPETGKKIPEVDAYGKVKTEKIQVKTTKMANAKDARELSSGHPTEEAYANYANQLKALANQSRKEAVAITPEKANPSAKILYSNELDSLNAKLLVAQKNKPRERQAQLIAYSEYIARTKENPYLEDDDIKKIKQQTLASARAKVGASKARIEITDKEWEAIQSGAVSPTKQRDIFDNVDEDALKKLATPRNSKEVTSIQESRIKSLANSGYTRAEIAERVGLSPTAVTKILKGS